MMSVSRDTEQSAVENGKKRMKSEQGTSSISSGSPALNLNRHPPWPPEETLRFSRLPLICNPLPTSEKLRSIHQPALMIDAAIDEIRVI